MRSCETKQCKSRPGLFEGGLKQNSTGPIAPSTQFCDPRSALALATCVFWPKASQNADRLVRRTGEACIEESSALVQEQLGKGRQASGDVNRQTAWLKGHTMPKWGDPCKDVSLHESRKDVPYAKRGRQSRFTGRSVGDGSHNSSIQERSSAPVQWHLPAREHPSLQIALCPDGFAQDVTTRFVASCAPVGVVPVWICLLLSCFGVQCTYVSSEVTNYLWLLRASKLERSCHLLSVLKVPLVPYVKKLTAWDSTPWNAPESPSSAELSETRRWHSMPLLLDGLETVLKSILVALVRQV